MQSVSGVADSWKKLKVSLGIAPHADTVRGTFLGKRSALAML